MTPTDRSEGRSAHCLPARGQCASERLPRSLGQTGLTKRTEYASQMIREPYVREVNQKKERTMDYHPTWHEYNSALHVLTAPLIGERTEPYVQANGFDWDGLLDDLLPGMSSGEQVLVRAAFDLWGGTRDDGYRPVNLREVAHRLDSDNRRRVIEAVAIGAGDYSLMGDADST